MAIGTLALVAVNLWWIAGNRHGYPFNVDEAGYTTIGLVDYFGLRNGGLDGWWNAVQMQTPVAPLVPALTSLLLVVKPGVLEGFGVLLGFLVLLAFAMYGIGERLAGPRLGALTALAAITTFGAFTFVREYIFALPLAALLAAAVYTMLRSEGFKVRRWSIACGAALGLMVLARTMAVAFVPGVVAAGVVVMLVRNRSSLLNSLANLGLLGITGVAVAATWYARNIGPVYDYLTGFGYGAQSNYYGDETSMVSWERWSTVAKRMISDDLLVPLAALLLVALVALAAVVVRRVVNADERRVEILKLAGTDAFAVALVFAAGYLALTSSQNGGNGFTFPIAMLLLPLAAIALRLYPAAAVPATIAVLATGALNLAATSNLWDSVAKPRLVDVPAFGAMPWINGTPHAVEAIRVQVPGPQTHFAAGDRGWLDADQKLARKLLDMAGPDAVPPLTAFASRNRVISSNSVGLAALAKFQQAIPFTQLQAEPNDTVGNYLRELGGPQLGQPTVLLTMDRNTDDFDPLVTQSRAEAAARKLGFRRVDAMALPDGRELRMWVKAGSEAMQAKVSQSPHSSGKRANARSANRRN